jgi:hypothetical protein
MDSGACVKGKLGFNPGKNESLATGFHFNNKHGLIVIVF